MQLCWALLGLLLPAAALGSAPVALFDYVFSPTASPTSPSVRARALDGLVPCSSLPSCHLVMLYPAIQERPPATLSVPLLGQAPVFLSLQYALSVFNASTMSTSPDAVYSQLEAARSEDEPMPIGYSTSQGGFAFLVFGRNGVTASIPFAGGFARLAPCLPADWVEGLPPMSCHTLSNVSVSALSALDVGGDVTTPSPSTEAEASGIEYESAVVLTEYETVVTQAPFAIPTPEDVDGDIMCSTGVLSADHTLCCAASCTSCTGACAKAVSSTHSCGQLPPPCNMQVVHTVTVAYTSEVKAVVGDMDAFIALAVADTNAGYLASNIPIRMVLQASYETTLAENVDSYALLMAFQGSDRHGANVAVLLSNELGACGRAFEDCSLYPSILCAYAVVNQACATGYFSFGHEIGHIQGADHNIEAMPPVGRFPDNRGYIIQEGYEISGGLRTVMSYAVIDELRVNLWSSPNLSYDGLPAGVLGQANNARVLTATRYSVAAFNTPAEPGFVPSASPTSPPPTTPPPTTPPPTPKPAADVPPSSKPSKQPTALPTSRSPSSREPTPLPTLKPTTTKRPSAQPTALPTLQPTAYPSPWPSSRPTTSARPTPKPTSTSPTWRPTTKPTAKPTQDPTTAPSRHPTAQPTRVPTAFPTTTARPSTSASPSARPTARPTSRPTSALPTHVPSRAPFFGPSASPSRVPTTRPTRRPSSSAPSSVAPSTSSPLTAAPSSVAPSSVAPSTSSPLTSSAPSAQPSANPATSAFPTAYPTAFPTAYPTPALTNAERAPSDDGAAASPSAAGGNDVYVQSASSPEPSARPTQQPTDRPSLRSTPRPSTTRRPTGFPIVPPPSTGAPTPRATQPKTAPPVFVLFSSPTASPASHPAATSMATTAANDTIAGSNVQAAAVSIPVVFAAFGAAAGVLVLYRRKSAREQMEQYKARAARAIQRVRDPEQGVVVAAVPPLAPVESGAAAASAVAE